MGDVGVQMREVTGKRYRYLEGGFGEEWVLVFGGDLPVPVDVRVERVPDGRYAFTGIRLGEGTGRERPEITPAMLRQIRLGEILADYVETFRPDLEAEFLSSLAAASRALPPPGYDPEKLLAFARTYQAELEARPHRAMTATARAHNMSRTTANRWAALCRELGYLPPRSGPG